MYQKRYRSAIPLFSFYRKILIPKLFPDQNDFNTVLDMAASGDDRLAADTVRGEAVGADSGGSARRLFGEPPAVHR